MNKELFEGPVGDYCIARNTIKFLFYIFFTDMNYAKRYDKCVVLFCSRHLLE